MGEKTERDAGQQLTFWGHLEVLRGVLIRIALTLAVAGVVAFVYMPDIFDRVILWPCRGDFPLYRLMDAGGSGLAQAMGLDGGAGEFSVRLINVQLASQLMIHFSASCCLALVATFPLLVWQLWRFVKPGLYERERREATRAFLLGNAMFYIGVAAGYFLVFPLALRFLADYRLSEQVSNTLTIDSYMDNFYTITLLMGAVFELPLLAWLLGKVGLLTRRFFSRYRRHAIVGLLVTAALITPTGDPFTLFAVFLPLFLLWELSAYLVPSARQEGEKGKKEVENAQNRP